MKLTPLDSSDKKALKRDFHRVGRKLAQDFLEAVRTGNHEAIFEMAKTLKFVTQFKPSPTRGDPCRKKILMLKRTATAKGAKWPIKILAKIIGWPHTNTDDGLSQLRRTCKELNFPITPEKVFRKYVKGK